MEKITVEQRFGRAAMVGLAGGAVAFAMFVTLPLGGIDWGILRSAMGGAFLAGLIVARGFGGSGGWGYFRAGFFFSIATVLGFFIGIMLLPVDEVLADLGAWDALEHLMLVSMAGPLIIRDLLGEGVLTLCVWCAGLVGSHLVSTQRPRVSL